MRAEGADALGHVTEFFGREQQSFGECVVRRVAALFSLIRLPRARKRSHVLLIGRYDLVRVMAINGNQWQSVAINGTCLIGRYDLVHVLLERIGHRLQYMHALLIAEQLQRACRRPRCLRLRL